MTEQLDRIRSHLDRCILRQHGSIDYHAVLLIHLRWFLSERLRKAFEPWERAGLGERADVVEYCLPWQAYKNDAGCQATAAMREKLKRTDAPSLYDDACFRAVAAAVIRATDKSGSGAKNAEAEADRAMAWLKQAYCITQANANTNLAGSQIEFDPSVFNANAPQSVTLSSTLKLNETAGLEAIDGPGASVVTISGNKAVQVFLVQNKVMATLSGLTISDGESENPGGGIDNGGTLTVSNCTVANNSAQFGAGIYNNGILTVTGNTTVESNTANDGLGGGIFNDGATVTVTDSTIESNSADRGGGIDNENGGTLTVSDCTIEGNSAKLGGGLVNKVTSQATVTDSTLSGNTASGPMSSASGGGGMYNSGTATLTGCTLADNKAAAAGGGIFTTSFSTAAARCPAPARTTSSAPAAATAV